MELHHCAYTLGPTQEYPEGGPHRSGVWFGDGTWCRGGQTTSRWMKTSGIGSLAA
jgi:hypothetical protein